MNIFPSSPSTALIRDFLSNLPESSEIERMHVLEPGTVLCSQKQKAHCIYLVEEGLVKLTRQGSTEGSVVLSFHASGRLFGEEAIGVDRLYLATASVVDSACVLRIGRNAFLNNVFVNQEMREQFVLHLLDRQQFLFQVIEGLSSYPLRYRLLWHLEQLCLDLTPDVAGGWALPLTQAEVANLVGGRRETVSLLLNELERSGLIRLARRKILVADPEQLSTARKGMHSDAQSGALTRGSQQAGVLTGLLRRQSYQ